VMGISICAGFFRMVARLDPRAVADAQMEREGATPTSQNPPARHAPCPLLRNGAGLGRFSRRCAVGPTPSSRSTPTRQTAEKALARVPDRQRREWSQIRPSLASGGASSGGNCPMHHRDGHRHVRPRWYGDVVAASSELRHRATQPPASATTRSLRSRPRICEAGGRDIRRARRHGGPGAGPPGVVGPQSQVLRRRVAMYFERVWATAARRRGAQRAHRARATWPRWCRWCSGGCHRQAPVGPAPFDTRQRPWTSSRRC
jgi:hypothetical protein